MGRAFLDFDVDNSEKLNNEEIMDRLNPAGKPVPDALWEGLFLMSKKKILKNEKEINEDDFFKLMKRGLTLEDPDKEFLLE